MLEADWNFSLYFPYYLSLYCSEANVVANKANNSCNLQVCNCNYV